MDSAREWLARSFPGEAVDIHSAFDVAYAGWEMDYQAAPVIHGGAPKLVIIDQTSRASSRVYPINCWRLEEHRRLISETEAVLENHRQLGGMVGDALADRIGRHGQALIPQRDPGETDEGFERRRQLFSTGSRVVLDADDLTEREIELIRNEEIRKAHRWSSHMPVVPGGAVVADLLAAGGTSAKPACSRSTRQSRFLSWNRKRCKC